jgi:epoxyqueuosine reductase QueG
VGFAPAARWDEVAEVPAFARPRALFAECRTVIVVGLSMPLPIVETTPSQLHAEAYSTTNRQLDALALELVRHLNRLGHASYFFTRDGFGSLNVLQRERPQAAFAHLYAAKYAGLGTIGLNHCVLTPEFGPRVRFVSVFTAADIPPDAVRGRDLCIQCGSCAQMCPVQALVPREDRVVGDFLVGPCLQRHQELTRRHAYPCGICTKVCPVGRDRALYRQKGILNKYREEAEALAANPEDPRYASWTHVRRYGAYPEQKEELEAPKAREQEREGR